MSESSESEVAGVKKEPLVIDLETIKSQCRDRWNFVPLAVVNGVQVSLLVVEGEYFSHFHKVDDEFYLVLDGQLTIETDGRDVQVDPGRALFVPAGVRHKAKASVRSVALNVKGFSGETVKLE